MRESLFSPLWYRVADQHPQLRAEVRVQRQEVRDQLWYLLVNAANGKQYRVNHKAWQFIGRCDGRRSVQQVWDDLLEQLRDEAPTQDEVIQTLNQLDQQDLLVYETTPDAKAMVRRRDERSRKRVQGFVNPFALRVPLGDPSRWLARLDRVPALIFNPLALCVWLVVMFAALIAAASHWDTMSAHAVQQMSTPRYLFLAWLAFPLIKALHELGHALAVRRWGGTVPEVGFSLFVLVPAPYVDASSSVAFRYRYQRLVVGAAGLMVELAIAAAALAVWLNVQPGLVADLAFVTMFIASVSTLVFNGNPLAPFDAYYIFCDALDLPNLSPRSKAWWTSAVLRLIHGNAAPPRMALSGGEGKWLVLYAPLSFAYRLTVATVLVFWLGSHSAVLGTIGAIALGLSLVVKPIWSAVAAVRAAAPAGLSRRRAVGIAAGAVGTLAALVFAVPVPFHTVARGVVWPPEQVRVRPATDGFVAEMLVRDGDRVAAGDVLVMLSDPALLAERDRLTSRLEQLLAGRFEALAGSMSEARNVEEEITRVQGELKRAEERIENLAVRAQTDGMLVMPHQQDLIGTFAARGSTLAYVFQRAEVGVRVAVPEYDAALVRGSTRHVEVRMAEGGASLHAELAREIPAATFDLPSAALGDRGGGPLPTDPADKEGLRTQQPVVLVDLKVPTEEFQRIGARAWVRFDHDAQPLASRWYRQARQLLLQHFNAAG